MTSSAISKPGEEAPAAGRYILDPNRTTVRFHARHLFGLGGVTGTVKLREAELIVGEPVTVMTLGAAARTGRGQLRYRQPQTRR